MSAGGFGGTCLRLDRTTLVLVDGVFVVHVHLEHVIALGALVDVILRELKAVEVAFEPVGAVERVDADDAELARRSLSRGAFHGNLLSGCALD